MENDNGEEEKKKRENKTKYNKARANTKTNLKISLWIFLFMCAVASKMFDAENVRYLKISIWSNVTACGCLGAFSYR